MEITRLEVDEILKTSGFDVAELREFAWQLVADQISDLPKANSARIVMLGKHLRRLISLLIDGGVSPGDLASVFEGIHAELSSANNEFRKNPDAYKRFV
jgi:hypothetical protein